jgi:hypothetical protein
LRWGSIRKKKSAVGASISKRRRTLLTVVAVLWPTLAVTCTDRFVVRVILKCCMGPLDPTFQ